MPEFTTVPVQEAQLRTIPGRQGRFINEYVDYIQRVPSGQAGRLRIGEEENHLTVRRRLVSAAQVMHIPLIIKRSGNELYFWRGDTEEAQPSSKRSYTRRRRTAAELPPPDQPVDELGMVEQGIPEEESPELGQTPGDTVQSRITVTQLAKELGPDGSQNTPAVNIGGADLGSVFDGLGRTWMLFGDTFAGLNPLSGHRQNTMAFTTDEAPSDGITFDGWITGEPSGFPGIDSRVLPAIGINDGLRCFVLIPSDNPLPGAAGAAQKVIQDRWNICINWLEASTSIDIKAFRLVVFLTMPFTSAQVLDASENGDLADFIFDWMETTTWRPRTGPLQPAETWLVIVRGAGGFADGLNVNDNLERVGWGIVADAVLSSWLSEAGLEPELCTLYTGFDPSFCTPNAQTGAAVHKLLHGLGAAHDAPTNNIMNNWWDFPNVPVTPTVRALIDGSPYDAGDLPTPLPRAAKELFGSSTPGRSAIPTHGVEAGGALYVYYQQPRFNTSGWETDLSSVQKSTDAGNTWTRLPGLTWVRPSNFAQVAIYKESYRNQIFNGEFSVGLTGWVEFIDSGITATTQRVDEPHYGRPLGALEINVPASDIAGGAGRYQDIRIDPNGTYLFASRFLGMSLTTAEGLLTVQWLDANQSFISGISVSSTNVSGHWVELRMDNQPVPFGAAYARVRLSLGAIATGGTGLVYFDRVEVRKTSGQIYFFGIPESRSGGVALMRVREEQIENKVEYEYLVGVPSVKQIVNADFESGLEGWELELLAPEITGAISHSATDGISGSGTMQMEIESVTGTASVFIRRAQQLPAGEGDVWNIDCKAKADLLQNCRIDFALVWRDVSGAIIDFTVVNSFDATGRFVPLSIEGKVAPAGTVSLEVQLLLSALSTTQPRSGICWFDEVRAVKGEHRWRKNGEHNAVQIVPAAVGEFSVAWNEYLQKYIMMGFMAGDIKMRMADRFEGPWSPFTRIMTQAQFPCQYAPFTKDSYVDEGGRIVYFRMSRFCPGFNPYSTYWMKLEFDA